MADCDQILVYNDENAITLVFKDKSQILYTIGRLILRLFKKNSVFVLPLRMNAEMIRKVN